MPTQTKKTNRNMVVQHNRLLNSRHSLSVSEQRIILSMVAQLKKEDKDFQRYRIKIAEFTELTGTKHKGMYTQARKVTKNLLSKVVEIVKPNGDILQTHFLGHALYKTGEGYVEVSFHPELKPYLLELKNNFTAYDIRNILPLTGKYTLRVYELLKQFSKIGERVLYVDELKRLLGVPEKYTYGHFKSRVLIPASEDLKQHTDMYFTFEEIKEGKKVTAIRFTIEKQQMNLSERNSPTLEIVGIEQESKEEINPNPLYEILQQAVISELGERTFISWFEGIEIEQDDKKITLYTDSRFKKDWILNHYQDLLREVFSPVSISIDVTKADT